ncbi:MAG: hypothetical protein IKD45_00975 [Clostridia bacterium]|nr:hypothetical protein [Clostridia bacterium]
MANSEHLARIVTDYLNLAGEIELKEMELPLRENEYRAEFNGKYERLKQELSGYFKKILPTVETVCGIYKSKIALSGGKLTVTGGMVCSEYTPLTAPELAIRYGSEAIKLLAAALGRNNVDVNLLEFAKRYNAIFDIYAGIDSLKAQATELSVAALKSEIAELKARKLSLCANEAEFSALISEVTASSDKVQKKALIGNKLEKSASFCGDITLPLAYEAIDGAPLGRNEKIYLSTLDWNFRKDGFFVLRRQRDTDGQRELSVFAANAVLQFLFAYPGLSLRVLLCDGYSTPEITALAGSIRDSAPTVFFEGEACVKNSKEDIRYAIGKLNRAINERIMLLGQSRYESISEYNAQNQDNTQPIILAVLNGYPTRFEEACDDLASALKNGKRAGVFFLITESLEESEDSRYYSRRMPSLDSLTANVATVMCERGAVSLSFDGRRYNPDTRGANYDVKSILAALKTSEKSEGDKTVYLDSVIENESFTASARRNEFSKNLRIPIGKKGAVPISIELRADAPTAHMAVIGTTGSGKTAFINSLVLSACNHYSPDELELHMMVMTKGDFTVFKDKPFRISRQW